MNKTDSLGEIRKYNKTLEQVLKASPFDSEYDFGGKINP